MDNKEILKQLAEEKLKAFTVGNMRRRTVSKQKLREQKQREDDEAIGHVFQEFFATFQEPNVSSNKVWVKGGTYNPEQKKEDLKEKGTIYKPAAKTNPSKDNTSTAVEKAKECAKLLNTEQKLNLFNKKKEKEIRKSNLELLKEEMKQIQEEREERHKIKTNVAKMSEDDFQLLVKNEMGNFDVCDPNTTNLYLGNLNPALTEYQLMEIFGKFGPLASVKIMWPRTEEEQLRGHNCGFVAFMNRTDSERALRFLNNKNILGYELRVSWGKFLPIPQHPVYVPPAFQQLAQPPPSSGLPFNAQPTEAVQHLSREEPIEFEKLLYNSIVKVVIPTDRKLLCIIHRMIEFVIREGPLFEAMIMKQEINNPLFRFLFDNQSHHHIYYRWKLFTVMQGDSLKEWRTDDFRMFAGGSIWRPPPINIYTRGMPEHLIDSSCKDPNKSLSVAQRERFIELLENLSPERVTIGEAMIFALQHGKAADEICNYILDKLKDAKESPTAMACLYLISDILNNCHQKIHNISQYRRAIDTRIIEMFHHAFNLYKREENSQKRCSFYLRIFHLLESWKKAVIFPGEFISRLGSQFEEEMPLSEFIEKLEDDNDDDDNDNDSDGSNQNEKADDTVNKNLDGKFNSDKEMNSSSESDVDGAPLSPSPPKIMKEDKRRIPLPPIHIPSKWD